MRTRSVWICAGRKARSRKIERLPRRRSLSGLTADWRRWTASLALFAAFAGLLGARTDTSPPRVDVTVILDFKGVHSDLAVHEMEREAGQILRASGVQLGWDVLGRQPGATYNDLVLMTFHGPCEYDSAPPRAENPGPYAMTHISNGEILPFGDVDCRRVVNSVTSAMSGDDFAHADQLVGRAMGRVVAHELVHMLTRSTTHGTEGVEKPALTGKQLIAPVLPLSAFDIDRMRQEHVAN